MVLGPACGDGVGHEEEDDQGDRRGGDDHEEVPVATGHHPAHPTDAAAAHRTTGGRGASPRHRPGRPPLPVEVPSGGPARLTVAAATAVAAVIRYTVHGGGPADGALYSAVRARPVSSTRAGQPCGVPVVRHRSHRRRVGDRLGLALHHQVEVVRGQTEGAPWVAGQVPTLAGAGTGFEPEGAVDPQGADSCDVGAAVPVDRGQPTGVTVRSSLTRRLSHASVEAGFDGCPFQKGR